MLLEKVETLIESIGPVMNPKRKVCDYLIFSRRYSAYRITRAGRWMQEDWKFSS